MAEENDFDIDAWVEAEDGRFVLVLHHGGGFVEFNHAAYNGIETVLECEEDEWAHFSVLSTVKRLSYTMINAIWYYEPYLVDELVRLRDDLGCIRMKAIAEMHGRVHLYVERNVCAPEHAPNLNPLIEYPLGHVDPHGADDVEEGGAHVEKVAVDEAEVVVEVEEVVVDVEDDVTEVEEVEVDKVGPDMESAFVGPYMGSGFDDVDTEVNEVGTTLREETNVGGGGGGTEDNEVIDVGPTHVSFEQDLNGPRCGVNGLAGSAGLEGELRTRLDDLIDVYGSDCEAVEKEDNELDVLFEDSEEEIGQEDNFGYQVSASFHHQFEDGVNLGEDVFVGGAAATETEPPTKAG
ncbi:uncharacterized protein [Medicago truncatula]|uniref:uncharacterized protein n=1 Tax=Medicago truncatula TaxID=3880 RepID=UPI000D2F198C|nr:uncharacterized protein LOC112419461 [Medicago truncatula]